MSIKFKFYSRFAFFAFALAAPLAFAAPQKTLKEFTFKFHYKDTNLVLNPISTSWEEAYKIASQDCFTKMSKGVRLNNDVGMDLIDVCANPR